MCILKIELTSQNRKYESQKQPEVFEINNLVFGVNPSPFEALHIHQEHALDWKDVFHATDTVSNLTCMGDSMELVEDENCGIQLYQELSSSWGKANLLSRKSLFNSAKIWEKIPAEDCK